MISTFFLSFLAFWIILLPIYLWGYGTTLVLGYGWHRMRFLMGILIGSSSVIVMYFLEKYIQQGGNIYLASGTILTGLLIFLLGLIVVLTHFGSPFARVFLRRIALVHAGIIFLITGVVLAGVNYIPSIQHLLVGASFSFLVASLFEETSKHLVSIGLAGQNFRFSKSDIIAFTLFSVLGFVFCENLIYLFDRDASLGQWIYRSFFTLVAHIFAASLCAYYWWKALSYELFSLRYIGYFIFGLFLASGIHALYNILLAQHSLLGIILYVVIGYMTLIALFARK